MQKDFVNNVTHELQTPLATLSLAAESITGKSAEKQSTYLGIIQNEIGKLQSNVNNILQASMVDATPKPTIEPLTINAFLDALVGDFRLQYASKMVEWELAGAVQTLVQTDKQILETALRNLVDNAIKYGGRNIAIGCQEESGKVMISITDDGKGIADKYRPHVFKKFYRVPEEENQQHASGFGLGLYMVKKSLQRVGASIILKSSVGKGSTFTINLPAHG